MDQKTPEMELDNVICQAFMKAKYNLLLILVSLVSIPYGNLKSLTVIQERKQEIKRLPLKSEEISSQIRFLAHKKIVNNLILDESSF